jgi:release factor glutamine methyltransferase
VDAWTIRRVLEWTAKDLASRDIPSARLDAEVLLAHVLGTDRLGLYLDLDRPLGEDERGAFRDVIARRRRREPVAYLTGTREFWSLPLLVTPDVLIPRPETETLVEAALDLLPAGSVGARAVDVGTGSGCVALALATERPGLRVLAVDIDRGAAAVAARNARALGLTGAVGVVAGDLLGPVGGPVDLVVANLPYVPTREIDGLEPEISRWEPRRALDGGDDGLDVFRRLLSAAAEVVRAGGNLALEVSHDEQAAQLVALIGAGGAWEPVRSRRDYGGVARVVVAARRA